MPDPVQVVGRRKAPFCSMMSTQHTPGSIIRTRNKQTAMVKETNLIRKGDENRSCPSLPKIQAEKLSYLTCVELLRNKSVSTEDSGHRVRRFVCKLVEMLCDAADLELTCVTCFKNGGRIFFLNEVCNEIGLWI
jgi:DNA-directed RNA polymerase